MTTCRGGRRGCIGARSCARMPVRSGSIPSRSCASSSPGFRTRRKPTAPAPVVAAPLPGTRAVLRLTLAERGGAFAGGDLVHEVRRRVVAVVADAAVLGAIGGAIYVVIGAFWAPLAVAIVGYYFGSILLLGNTPGRLPGRLARCVRRRARAAGRRAVAPPLGRGRPSPVSRIGPGPPGRRAGFGGSGGVEPPFRPDSDGPSAPVAHGPVGWRQSKMPPAMCRAPAWHRWRRH